MHFEEINSGDVLQLNVQGKIDATSAGEFQNSVLRAFIKSKNIVNQNSPGKEWQFDRYQCTTCSYGSIPIFGNE